VDQIDSTKISTISSTTHQKSTEYIITLLNKWNNTITYGSYQDYVQYYALDYVPDINWWREWINIRRNLITSDPEFKLKVKYPLIVKHNEIFTILFDQILVYGSEEIVIGSKKFFVKEQEDQFIIIAEAYQNIVADAKNKDSVGPANPLIAQTYQLKKIKPDESLVIAQIKTIIDGWLTAWSSKDIKRYGDYYTSDFRSQNMNKKAWLVYKDQLNKKYDYIRISKSKLKIKPVKDKYIVSFQQAYKSNTYQATGMKKLILKDEDGQWKIYRETWTKN